MADTKDSILIRSNAERGNVKFFEEVAINDLRSYRDENRSHTVLTFAASIGQLDCCKAIYKRCPELLYTTIRDGSSALHQAAGNGQDAAIEFLLRAGVETAQDIESGKQGEIVDHKLLTMVDNYKRTALHYAQRKRHITSAKLLLKADPRNYLLRMADVANDTVLHLAVKNRDLEFVKLVLETDAYFFYAPNDSMKTPHLLALEESFSDDPTTVEIRKRLIQKQPAPCQMPLEKRWTLLHHATRKGDITAIDEILEFSPDCAKLVDKEGQNFIHIAAKLEHVNVLRHIMSRANVDDNVLNQQDIHGNTPLHIATSTGNADMVFCMLYDARVDKLVKNKQGKTALAAIHFDYDRRRARVYGYMVGLEEKDLKDRSEFDLLVGALISTVSFTAGITVPGGFFSAEDPNMGNAVLYKKWSFDVFVLSNTLALTLSLYAVFCHFCTKRLVKVESILHKLKVATYCTLGAIFAMMISFITGSYAVLEVSNWLGISVGVICGCFFCFALHAMWGMIMEQRERRPRSNHSKY